MLCVNLNHRALAGILATHPELLLLKNLLHTVLCVNLVIQTFSAGLVLYHDNLTDFSAKIKFERESKQIFVHYF